MTIRWYEEAAREADSAAEFYQGKQSGLEQRFLEALEDALLRLRRRPRMYPKIEGEIRKCKLPRFPYGIIFRLSSERIEIIAVMHLRRSPGYWRKRI